MANKNQVVGQVRVKVDGQLLETDGSSTMDLGGPSREPVMGDYQAGSYRESVNPSKCEMNLLMKPGLSLANIQRIDDATVTMQADTGHVYVMSNAYVAEVITFTTSDGKAKVVMQAGPAEELRNG